MAVIQANNLTKFFGLTTALSAVDIAIEQGSTSALVGSNGAGKSTLLRVLCGVMRPDEGEVLYGDCSLYRNRDSLRLRALRAQFGVALDASFLYRQLTARENLVLYAKLYQLEQPQDCAARMLERLALNDAGEKKVCELSQGMLKRLTLGRALLHEPSFVFFDEPFANLDAASRDMLSEEFVELKSKDVTVLFSSHEHDLVRQHADRVVILNSGKLAKETTVENYREDLHVTEH